MKLFTGWALAAGLALTAGAASAQVLGPSRVSDFGGPYIEGPYRGGPYYAPPPAEVAPPPPRYGYGGYGPGYAPGYAPAALVPPHEVYNIIRQAGFSPLSVPRQRGFIYTIAVVDRGGEDGRLVIDARSGRILRFVPAWQNGSPYEGGAWNSSYGPPGPLPPGAGRSDLRSDLKPQAPAPRVASRSVPVPKPSPSRRSRPSPPSRLRRLRQNQPLSPRSLLWKPPSQFPSLRRNRPRLRQPSPRIAAPATTGTIGQTQAKPAPSILPDAGHAEGAGPGVALTKNAPVSRGVFFRNDGSAVRVSRCVQDQVRDFLRMRHQREVTGI